LNPHLVDARILTPRRPRVAVIHAKDAPFTSPSGSNRYIFHAHIWTPSYSGSSSCPWRVIAAPCKPSTSSWGFIRVMPIVTPEPLGHTPSFELASGHQPAHNKTVGCPDPTCTGIVPCQAAAVC